jgi:U3 small nucleolar RNA-associated protein 11
MFFVFHLRVALIVRSQKIDKIKAQLTEMSDLVRIQSDDENLETEPNEDEAKILREAEIFRHSRKKVKSKHVLFASSSAEGQNVIS